MNISICITTFNEEKSISALLDSLLVQTKKPEAIIIVDGGSTDKTVEIIRHYQQKDNRIKLLVEKCTRAKGRNYSVEIAKTDIIATTDAGCVAQKDWLEKISEPFKNDQVDIVAGFYSMVGKNDLQKAMSYFLGVTPSQFDARFLPSARSMAFSRSAWEAVGGFPEGKENSAEDTDFNYKAVKIGLKYARVKNAIVEWGMPSSISKFQFTIFNYAKWDARYGIWKHSSKSLTSHNIKVLLVLLRYVIGFIILVLSFKYHYLFPYLVIGLLLYCVWSFRKVYLEFQNIWVGVLGVVLQFVCDYAVIKGFVSGILDK